MGFVAERRRIAWRLSNLVGVPLLVAAITFLGPTSAGHGDQVDLDRQIVAAQAVPHAASRVAEVCAEGEEAIELAEVGTGIPVRCLPVGGDEVKGSRVDALYGRVAAALIGRIPGHTAASTANLKVVCWSQKDWRKLSHFFADAGEYWLGWAPRGRSVINLSYPACVQLDRIAYHAGSLALPAAGAAVGTLAHETVHVAGIPDEGIADCYAMQLTSVTALGLDAERDYADELQALYFDFVQEQHSGTEYDSPDCYDGGPLDLAPEDSRWP